MTTRANMRSLVRQLLDDTSTDTEEQRWSDSEIDFSLEAALEVVLVEHGQVGTIFDQQAEITTSSGSYAMTTEKPIIIKSVAYKYGQTFIPLLPGDDNAPSIEGADATLRVTYVGKPTFPTSEGQEMAYGATNGLKLKVIDRLVAIRAALDLLPKDAERNPSLEQQAALALDAVMRASSLPKGRDLVLGGSLFDDESSYFSGRTPGYRWAFVPGTQTIKLVF